MSLIRYVDSNMNSELALDSAVSPSMFFEVDLVSLTIQNNFDVQLILRCH